MSVKHCCIEEIEDMYAEWLEENCQCPCEEECVCQEMNEWFEEMRCEWELSLLDNEPEEFYA